MDAKNWQKLLTRVNKSNSGCWEWSGPISPNGYVSVRDCHKGQRVYMHRASWEWYYGAIPNDKVVMHLCDNRRCCNPEHLQLGTQKENLADAKTKNRIARGEMLPQTKLNEILVRKIRKEYAERKLDQYQLAAKYGVSQAQIGRIIRKENWLWVT